MQNTLPSLLVTAIFLKLMSSRAPETSLSLELPGGVKWADNQGAGKYISGIGVCSPMNKFNASTSKCFFFPLFFFLV